MSNSYSCVAWLHCFCLQYCSTDIHGSRIRLVFLLTENITSIGLEGLEGKVNLAKEFFCLHHGNNIS